MTVAAAAPPGDSALIALLVSSYFISSASAASSAASAASSAASASFAFASFFSASSFDIHRAPTQYIPSTSDGNASVANASSDVSPPVEPSLLITFVPEYIFCALLTPGVSI